MSYIYDQRRSPQGHRDPAPIRTAAPGPAVSARKAGTVRPTAARTEQSMDLDGAMQARMKQTFGDLSAVKQFGSPGADMSGGARAEAQTAAGGQAYTGPVTHTLSGASPSPAAAGPMQAKRASTISREAADKAAQGDYSEYYKINSKDKQDLTAETKNDIKHSLRTGMSHRGVVKVYGGTTSDKLNPVTRQAMSEMIRDKDTSNAEKMILTNAMETMDEEIMMQTMHPVSDKQRDALKEHYRNKGDLKRLQKEYRENGFFKSVLGEETMSSSQVNAALNGSDRSEEEIDALAQQDVNQANQSGEAMLKLMLLMQMGHFIESTKRQSGDKDTKNWYKSMANSLSYGGRVGFLFDSSKEGGGGGDALPDGPPYEKQTCPFQSHRKGQVFCCRLPDRDVIRGPAILQAQHRQVVELFGIPCVFVHRPADVFQEFPGGCAGVLVQRGEHSVRAEELLVGVCGLRHTVGVDEQPVPGRELQLVLRELHARYIADDQSMGVLE